MQHAIRIEQIGAQGPEMTAAIESCVHCGFCLPTCPTYAELGEEMDSPRGRIVLMKEVLEGKLDLGGALPYIDNCLGCLACQTACPSGVEYEKLITPFRAYAEERRERTPLDRARRRVVLSTLQRPKRFRLAALSGRLARPVAGILPRSLAAMLRLLPDRLPAAQALPELHPAEGERRARVALLAGCAQQALAPEINLATLRVLARNGVETVIPRGQGCCGALAMHAGDAERAKGLARNTIAAFPAGVDAVVTNAAGCGSGMREYGLLLAGEDDRHSAEAFAGRVLDVSVFLDRLGLREAPPAVESPIAVAYHDACHLAHAQGVLSEPRRLLEAIDGVTLVEPAERELCCGSAGIYNVERPEIADRLGRRKAQNLIDSGAALVATGNIGCMVQVRTQLARLSREMPVLHTMQVLDRAYAQNLKEHAK